MATISGTLNQDCKIIILDSNHNKIRSEEFCPGDGGDTYNKLLLHMDEEFIKDSSKYRRPVTKYGYISRSNAASKFGGYSWYFDGGDDAISVPNSSDFAFGNGDYTIECWVNFSSLPTSSVYRTLFSYRNGTASRNSTSDIFMGLWNGSGNYYWRIYVYNNGTSLMDFLQIDNSISTGTWYHIAFVRKDNYHTIYKNGTYLGAQYANITYPSITDYLMIGFSRDSGDLGNTRMHGYIDEYRISKGIARWYTSSAPPSSGYTLDSDTKLLLHGEESPLSDEAGKAITLYGSIARSDTQKKFGSYSIYFDGINDYITLPNSQDFQFGSGDFTIDFWTYPTTYNIGTFIALSINTSNAYAGIRLQHDASWLRPQLFMSTTGTSWDINGATAGDSVLPLNSWSHIALSRKGTVICLFVNGGLYWSGTLTGSLMSTTTNLIGTILYNPSPFYFTGYMDEVRISKGIARWTKNFTTPTGAYKTHTLLDSGSNYKYGVENISTSSGTVISVADNGEMYGYYNMSYIKQTQDATGGTVVYYDNYKVHSFTANGSFSLTTDGVVDLLVVGAGGGAGGEGGGTACQAGGGGGRVLEYLNYNLSAGTYNITIGQGGNNTPYGTGVRGGTTYFGSVTASGGYGAYTVGHGGMSASGYAGSAGGGQNYVGGGGGGNAQASPGTTAGGNGTASSIRTGSAVYYGGGGRGVYGYYCNAYGTDGLGGGASNFGGGASVGNDSRGGHGLVVVRYRIT